MKEVNCQLESSWRVLLSFLLITLPLPSLATELSSNILSKEEIIIVKRLFIAPPKNNKAHSAYSGVKNVINFGEKLFNDKRLSKHNDVSCSTCHIKEKDWTDGLDVPVGGNKNTPTLWHSAKQDWLFWDGRADSLFSQIAQVIENPNEHNLSKVHLLKKLEQYSDLKTSYINIFGEYGLASDIYNWDSCASNNSGILRCRKQWSVISNRDREIINLVLVNISKSIGAYIESLTPPKTKFDLFLENVRKDNIDNNLNDEELLGLKIFIGKGMCTACHSGPYLRDGEFHDIRIRSKVAINHSGRFDGVRKVIENEFSLMTKFNDFPDRFIQTKFLKQNSSDWGSFKTPTLYRISQTAPYMHEGQIKSLEEVVEHYSTFSNATPVNHHTESFLQPLFLSDAEKKQLVAFLNAL